MERRDFLKKAGLTAAGALVAPYILPSGRLFAKTGNKKVNHVVYCLFAGGIRNRDSVKQEQSNLMSTMLKDITPFSAQNGFINNLPANPLGTKRLQEFGTLYKEARFAKSATGHYNGHMVAMTGKYTTSSVNLRANPEYPTIFEYYRKHSDPSSPPKATNAWWISDSLGPYPLLNYSSYPGYGAAYGANYIQPRSLITGTAYLAIGDPQDFTDNQSKMAAELRGFCDGNFAHQYQSEAVGLINTPEDQKKIQAFIDTQFNTYNSNPFNIPTGMNSDLWNIHYAEKVLEEFQPELLVLNLQDVDICHSDFTSYCNNLRLADWGVSHLWNFIQTTPGLADETALVIIPEHGRNDNPNTLVDMYGRPAYDHTNEDAAREIFALICGPSDVIKQDQTITEVKGETVDMVPTIANLLGFDTDIPSSLIDGEVRTEAFV